MKKLYIANGPPKPVPGNTNNEYLATLINPVDKRLYDVVLRIRTVYIVAPMPNSLYKTGTLQVYGSGAYDNDDSTEIEYDGETETYFRSHTPSGVTKKGAGLGLVLYSGLSLAAKTEGYYTDVGGVYSSNAERLGDATRWWKAQVSRGYAEQEGKWLSGYGEVTVEVDEDTIGDIESLASSGYFGTEMEEAENVSISEYSPSSFEVEVHVDGEAEVQYLPAKKVAESNLVVAWNTELDEFNEVDELLSEWVELPPAQILSELDLTTVGDVNLILNLWDVLVQQEATPKQKKQFLEHVPPAFSVVPEILQLQGQQTLPFEEVQEQAQEEVAANPRPRVKHTRAWDDYFGELSESVEMNPKKRKKAPTKRYPTVILTEESLKRPPEWMSKQRPVEYVPRAGGSFEAQVVGAAVSTLGVPEEISSKKDSVQMVYSPRDFSIGGKSVQTREQEARVSESLKKQLAEKLPEYRVSVSLKKPDWSTSNQIFLFVER